MSKIEVRSNPKFIKNKNIHGTIKYTALEVFRNQF